MRISPSTTDRPRMMRLPASWRLSAFFWLPLVTGCCVAKAQTTSQESLLLQIQQLTISMARTQAQVEESQRQLDQMRKDLQALQAEMAKSGSAALPSTPPASSPPVPGSRSETAGAIEDLRERQAMQEAQIATHDQTKVETESKYPVKITGLLLMNSFVNTSAVDAAATPALSIGGPGSTGASVRQTILGFDARGPHLFGASSYADLRVDFDGTAALGSASTNYSGYYDANATFLRLRTAHAGLQWTQRELFFSLDRPIFSPDTPSSLTAVAVPGLAWSGNLWTWNPQLGWTQDAILPRGHNLRLQAALIDVGDAPYSSFISASTNTSTAASTAERSRWPGMEARIALLDSKSDRDSNHLGAGGYFAPHHSPLGYSFDAWAATLDGLLHLPAHLQLTGSSYRGRALGGLGAGGYKDFMYYADLDTNHYYFRALDDAGGWVELKEKLSQRVEFNAALGMDNVFAHELRPYYAPGGSVYQNLARNRTWTGNVIYSPSAYLLFSLEYRHLESSPVTGRSWTSNVIGIGAGYKF